MALQLIPNEVVEAKITDIANSMLDMRALFTVDNSLEQSAGMIKKIYKYTYSATVEQLQKGAKNSAAAKGAVSLSNVPYTVKRYQQTYVYNDMDVMEDPNIVNVLADGAGKTMANEVRAEYFTELAKISNTFDATGYNSLYEAVVDAVAQLPKAAEMGLTRVGIRRVVKLKKAAMGKTPLTLGEDFKVYAYSNNTAKGTATVVFKGIGEYSGYKSVTYKIGQRTFKDHWKELVSFFAGLTE